MNQKRQRKGTKDGGKFAPDVNAESTVVLDDDPDRPRSGGIMINGTVIATYEHHDIADYLPTPHLTLTQSDVATAYKTAALWSSTDDDGNSLDSSFTPDDISEESNAEIAREVVEFWEAAKSEGLVDGVSPEQFGHDFYLTRTGHGAGFWDRGRGDAGDRLTEMAHAYREKTPIEGDDGKIYFE